jgi:hypothetical protein
MIKYQDTQELLLLSEEITFTQEITFPSKKYYLGKGIVGDASAKGFS